MEKKESRIKRFERLKLNPITGWPTPKRLKSSNDFGLPTMSIIKPDGNGFKKGKY